MRTFSCSLLRHFGALSLAAGLFLGGLTLSLPAEVIHEKLPPLAEGQTLALGMVDSSTKGTMQIAARYFSVSPKKPTGKDAKDAKPGPTHCFVRVYLTNTEKKLEKLKVEIRYFLKGSSDADLSEQPAEVADVDYVEKTTCIASKGYDVTKTKADPKDHKPAAPTTFVGIILTIKDKDGTVLYCGFSDPVLKKLAKGE